MLLFHLLRASCVGLLLLGLLMVLLLLLRQLLMLLLLLLVQLLLLLCVFLVLLGVAGVRRLRHRMRRHILSVSRHRGLGRFGLGSSSFGGRTCGLVRRTIVGVRRGSAIGRRMIRRTGFLSWYCLRRQIARTGGRRDGRLALVRACPQLRIGARCLDLLVLRRHRGKMPIARCRFFGSGGRSSNSAIASVVADVVDGYVVDGGVVSVVNVGDVDIVDGAVVIELITLPASAFVTVAEVTETVVDAAIKSDDRPPIAFMEGVAVVVPTPVRGRPIVAGLRHHNPCAGHPVVVAVTGIVRPVAGRPDVTLARAKWLLVYRQCRRSKADHNADLRKGRQREQHQRE